MCSVLREDKRRELNVEGGASGSEWTQKDKNLPGNETLMDVPKVSKWLKLPSFIFTRLVDAVIRQI